MNATELWTIRPMANREDLVMGDTYRFTVLTDRLLRMEYAPDGGFRDSATQLALCRAFETPEFSVRESETRLVIETAVPCLVYDKQPFSKNGLSVTLKGAYYPYTSVWHYGEACRTLGGTARTLDNADGASMDMTSDGRLAPCSGHGVDLYLFAYGHDFAACLRDFLALSGRVPAVLDMNWHQTKIDPVHGTGWTGYTWDDAYFPVPEKLLSWLHAHGLRVTLNDHPADGVRV